MTYLNPEEVTLTVSELIGDTTLKHQGKILRFMLLVANELGIFIAPCTAVEQFNVSPTGTVSMPPTCINVKLVGQLVNGRIRRYGRDGAIMKDISEGELFVESTTGTRPKDLSDIPVELFDIYYEYNRKENRIIINPNGYALPETLWVQYEKFDKEAAIFQIPIEYERFVIYRLLEYLTVSSYMSRDHRRKALAALENVKRRDNASTPLDIANAFKRGSKGNKI